MGLVAKENRIQILLESAVEQHQKEELEAANLIYEEILNSDPNNVTALQLSGVLASQVRQYDVSLNLFNKALSIYPSYIDALNNRGLVLKKVGRFDEALSDFNKVMSFKPDDFESLNNRGIVFNELQLYEKALLDFNRALFLKPNNAVVYNNRGNTLKNLQRFDEALDDYNTALSLDPECTDAFENVIEILAGYEPQKTTNSSLIIVNQDIQRVAVEKQPVNIISDGVVLKLLSESLKVLKNHDVKIGTYRSQIYRKNSIDLNCNRHIKIFEKHSIIPEFCFGCYKVQIEPQYLIELIKLFIIFDQLKLDGDNTRKCMVELRPEVAGFYKGLVYCSNLKEANEIAKLLRLTIKEKIGSKLSISVKRGCSEYYSSFPDYKKINNTGKQQMSYDDSWRQIEKEYDDRHSQFDQKKIVPSLLGLNISDALIIQNWISYAKGIGDFSYDGLGIDATACQQIHNQASARIKIHPYSD